MNFDNLGDSAETEGLENDSIGDADMMNEFGFAGETQGKRRVGEATIVIIAALVVAAGGLYGMRWLGSQADVTKTDGALEAKVEAFLQNIVGHEDAVAKAKHTAINPQEINDRLADDRTNKQVPLNETKQNPFHRRGEDRADTTTDTSQRNTTPKVDPAELARQRRLKMQQRLENAAADIWVTSILGREGKRIAQIEVGAEKIHVAVGHPVKIDSQTVFMVKQIDAMSVLLAAEGLEFTIVLGE